jgi:hypothetical protein
MYRLYRLQIIGTLGALSLMALFLIYTSSTGSTGPGWVFTAVWTAGLVYAGGVFLWRVVYELRLEDGVLTWKTPLRSGSVPVSAIIELRPLRSARNGELIRLAGGPKLIVMMRRGFQAFVDDLSRQAPGLRVTVSPAFSKLAERWPGQGQGGYERHK